MNWKKTFVGYDLGDGESITDYVVMKDSENASSAVQTNFVQMTMPDSNTPGKAIPTAYGYDSGDNLVFANSVLQMPDLVHSVRVNFKRRPSDLLPALSEQERAALLGILAERWPTREECPACHTGDMAEFAEAVITFTNAVFTDESYSDRIRANAVDCDEIVFCVGHPTRWDDLDAALYRSILSRSVLGGGTYAGKQSSLILAAESRAAYLTIRDKARKSVLPVGTCALLIDVGSSTIDLTAVNANAHNYQYNSGNNYLGARSIDYLIHNLYTAWLKETPAYWESYQKQLRDNPSLEDSLLLACRMAKESVYSTGSGVANIQFLSFPMKRIMRNDIDQLVRTQPIAGVLAAHFDLPQSVAKEMGNQTWIDLFRAFMKEKKAEMTREQLVISRIVITGSASKMPFVREIVKETYSELPSDGILPDMDPSRSISMGLALVGPSNEKSVAFQNDLKELLTTKLPEIVGKSVPLLADPIARIIEGRIVSIVGRHFERWQNGDITTLNDMSRAIEADCSKASLTRLLDQDASYKNAIKSWLSDSLGKDIALELQRICRRYGVDEFTIDDLNITNVPSVSIGATSLDPGMIGDAIVVVLSIIAGIIAAVILPTVLGLVIGIISLVLPTIAGIILGILMALPGVGWAVLIGLVGLAVVRAAKNGLGGAKEQIMEKLQSADLPKWVRGRITKDRILNKIQEQNIKGQITEALTSQESASQIAASVSQTLKDQVQKRAEDIKYVIESR